MCGEELRVENIQWEAGLTDRKISYCPMSLLGDITCTTGFERSQITGGCCLELPELGKTKSPIKFEFQIVDNT